jgi:hypothetical protein
MATIAVFIALGGASYAAFKLPKNSVGTKQLKKNAVTTKKIQKEAVTGAKVKKGTLTGKQIDASTLGTVPNASHATVAGGADELGGQPAASYASVQLEPIHYVGAPGEPNFEPECENYEPTNIEAIGFYKDSFGIVHLVGTGQNCLGKMFTLPDAFRPPRAQRFSGGLEEIFVASTGEVKLYGTPTAELDGITFRAES